jgi:hypothetical protein
MMNIVQATRAYESWLGARIPLIPADVRAKHRAMSEGPFAFLRATFYRWAQVWPELSPETAKAPEALAIGDLHVENFGTWRDAEGRLIWGVNDFDEACWMPYTCDLVRLAASTHLAIATEKLSVPPGKACESILEGYVAGLRAGGRAFVLAEHHEALRTMAVERLKQPHLFWEKLHALPLWRGKIAGSARKALVRAMPAACGEVRIAHRVSGLGSLGRRRFVATADWHGGSVAREAKELAESAWLWAHPRKRSKIEYADALQRSVRCPDPFVALRGKWIVRRLAPDCSRIELLSLPRRSDTVRLLEAMGFETANVHLGSLRAKEILSDLEKRPDGWLHESARKMARSVEQDWREWKRSVKA